jgi:hypothetical protein
MRELARMRGAIQPRRHGTRLRFEPVIELLLHAARDEAFDDDQRHGANNQRNKRM